MRPKQTGILTLEHGLQAQLLCYIDTGRESLQHFIFLGKIFFPGFSSPFSQISGNLTYFQTIPEHHLVIIIILIILALFKYECVREWCLCLCVRVISEKVLVLS